MEWSRYIPASDPDSAHALIVTAPPDMELIKHGIIQILALSRLVKS